MIDLGPSLLPGVRVMANPHPLLVHLPIALFLSFFVAELAAVVTRSASLRHAASWMLYFGTVGAALTVATGLWAAETVEHSEEVHVLMERHETYGLAVLSLGVLLSLWRIVQRATFAAFGQWIHLTVALVLVGTMTLGADLGGMMVYGHAVGVRNPPQAQMDAMPLQEEAESLQPELLEEETDESVQSEPSEELEAPPAEQPSHMHTHTHKHPHKHGKR